MKLYKATTRRTKGAYAATEPFEGVIHEAEPLISWVEPAEGDPGYWLAGLPNPAGFALSYVAAQQYQSEEQARAGAERTMERQGWRRTRAEAEADMAAEIDRRKNFRADGTPRVKPAKSPAEMSRDRIAKRLAARARGISGE